MSSPWKQFSEDAFDVPHQLRSGFINYFSCFLVPLLRRLRDQGSECSNHRARVCFAVKPMQQTVRVFCAGRFEQQRAKRRCGSPAFLILQGRAQRTTHKIERTAFIAEDISPSAGASLFARRRYGRTPSSLCRQ